MEEEERGDAIHACGIILHINFEDRDLKGFTRYVVLIFLHCAQKNDCRIFLIIAVCWRSWKVWRLKIATKKCDLSK